MYGIGSTKFYILSEMGREPNGLCKSGTLESPFVALSSSLVTLELTHPFTIFSRVLKWLLPLESMEDSIVFNIVVLII
jgi:hypothetical protein